jgi:hypothetical protein
MRETNIDKVAQSDWVSADDATEKGYYGYTPDDTPNEDYTVAGVTKAVKQAADKPDAAPSRAAAAKAK